MRIRGRFLVILLLTPVWGTGLAAPRTPAPPPTFTEVDVGFTGLTASEVRWGDYNNDGLLDLAIHGITSGARWTRIYKNNGGTFSEDLGDAAFIGLNEGPVLWGDYNNDGFLDLAYTGWSGGGTGSRIIRSNGAASFTELGNPLRGMKGADGAWFDYDNNGSLDLLVAGESYDPPQGDYAQIYRNDGNNVFTLAVNLPGLYLGQVAVGDFNNDGRLDVALTGRTVGAAIFRNDGGGTFTDINAGLPPLINSAIAWGDYDNDGLLDFAICGQKGDGSLYFEIYHNNGGGNFTPINAGLPGVHTGELHWGDYDNDGALDLLVTGIDATGTPIARVYRNTGGGVFVDAGLGLTGVWNQSSAAWGDYDNDGNLDIILAGQTSTGASVIKVYRNNGTVPNTAPTAPPALSATATGNQITFSWGASTDAQTPGPGLTYNLRVGTTPGGQQIMAAMSDLATGRRRIPDMGNVQHNRQWTLNQQAPGTYYFSVQAVDTGFMGSAWAAEQSVTVVAPPTVTAMVPAPGSTLVSPPATITLTLSAGIDPATATPSTVRLIRAGPDGIFGTADDVAVVPSSVTVVGGNQVQINLAGVRLPNDLYRVGISGTTVSDPVAIGHWELDESGGATAFDTSGSGLNGTLVNGPTRIAGRTGSALHFNGVDQSVDIPDSDLLSPHVGPSGEMSLSAWVRVAALPASGGPRYAVVAKGNDTNWEYQIFLYPDGSVSFAMTQSNNSAYAEARGGQLTPGVWHHIAGTMKKGQFVKVYLDGIQVDDRLDFSGDTLNLAAPLRIGASGPTPAEWLSGDADDLRLFNRALTADEVRDLAAQGGALRDLSGNVLDGEFTGSFPSGNGASGGDFVAGFTLNAPSLRVTSVVPAPGAALTSPPASITLTLSSSVDPDTVNLATVRLIRAGSDGALGTADDVVITPSSVALLSPNQIRIALGGLTLPDDLYGITLSGSLPAIPGRVNYWAINEGIGSVAADSSGPATGSIAGPVWVPGRVSNALHFNGISDRIITGATPLAAPWTAAMWVKREDSPSADSRLMDPATFSGGSLRLEAFNNTNRVGVAVYTVGDYPSSYTAPIGQWVHLAFVGTASQTFLYVDGEFADSIPASFAAPRYYIGSQGYNTLLGTLDDVQIFGRNLTATELRSLAALGGAVRDLNGNLLDGEFSGTFPSGNGVGGGNFASTFGINIGSPPSPPGAFTLAAPGSGQVNVSTDPTYAWSSASGAVTYTLQVATDSGFLALVVNQPGIATTSFTPAIALGNSTLYFWRVTAVNTGGTTLSTGAPWAFTTVAGVSVVDLRVSGCGQLGLELLIPWMIWRRRRRIRIA